MSERPIDLAALAEAKAGGAHSIFSPSSSDMWSTCSGSLIANALSPDTAGYDAAWGTVAHSISEAWRNAGEPPLHRLGEVVDEDGWHVEIDDEMFYWVRMNVERTDLLPPGIVEVPVPIDHVTPIRDQYGRADFITFLDQGRTIVVWDDKYGKAHRVSPVRNPQAMLYALGAIRKYDIDDSVRTIRVMIGQPRMDNFDTWDCSRDELMQFAGYIRERARLAWRLDAPRTPGDHCLFCRVKATCTAYAAWDIQMVAGIWGPVDEPPPEIGPVEAAQVLDTIASDLNPYEPEPADPLRMSTEHLLRLYPHRAAHDKFWHALSDELTRRAADGKVKGWKVVAARARRKYLNEDEAVLRLVEAGVQYIDLYDFKPRIVSPPKVERLLRLAGHRPKDVKAIVESIVVKPPGNPTLVPASDPREPLADPSSVFGPVEDDEDEDL